MVKDMYDMVRKNRVFALHLAGWLVYYYFSMLYHQDLGYDWAIKWMLILYIPVFYVFYWFFQKGKGKRLDKGSVFRMVLFIPGIVGWSYIYLHILLPYLGLRIHDMEVSFSWTEFVVDVFVGCYRMACYAGILVLAESLYQKTGDYLQLLSKKKQVKLESLAKELSSHTQFDLLNQLHTMVHESNPELEGYVLDLAAVQRYSSHVARRQLVPLTEELTEVKRLAKMMGEDYFDQNPDWLIVQGDCSSCHVPSMMLLGLLENACKYGDLRRSGSLSLRVTMMDRDLGVLCKNRISGSQDHRKSLGIGNENLRKRLTLLFPGQAHFDTFEREGFFYAQIYITYVEPE